MNSLPWNHSSSGSGYFQVERQDGFALCNQRVEYEMSKMAFFFHFKYQQPLFEQNNIYFMLSNRLDMHDESNYRAESLFMLCRKLMKSSFHSPYVHLNDIFEIIARPMV